MNNICLMADSYKMGHYKQYPINTQRVYSYFEPRLGAKFNDVVFFGLQYILKKHFLGNVVTKEKIDNAEKIIDAHLGKGVFNREGWEYILNKNDGKLPIEIKAVPEGSVIPINNVLMTIENTDDNCWWLTNYMETILSQIWYPCTVATLSYQIKKLLKHFLHETSTNDGGLNFQLHDFGYRGTSSYESAGIGGAAHLLNFNGTDTIAALECVMDYYNSNVCAYSVPATEHSIMTALGKEGEEELFAHLLKTHPTGILSVVIDSYDYANFIKIAGTTFKEQILNRDGIVVFRPDSGSPTEVSCHVVKLLNHYFGSTLNSKGYKVLNPKVKMLWGDGIGFDGIHSILLAFLENRYSTENIVFGMGGGLLQKMDRDTMRFAFKCSAQKRDNVWHDIRKNPLDSSKKSKCGKLVLFKNIDNSISTQSMLEGHTGEFFKNGDMLKTVFLNGDLLKDFTFDEIKINTL